MTEFELDIRMGIWRHYKGPLYQVIGLAHDANADELTTVKVTQSVRVAGEDLDRPMFTETSLRPLGQRIVVVYIPLQLDGAHLGPRMAVRTLEDFLSTVPVATRLGSPGVLDGMVARFTYLGPVLTAEMAQ